MYYYQYKYMMDELHDFIKTIENNDKINFTLTEKDLGPVLNIYSNYVFSDGIKRFLCAIVPDKSLENGIVNLMTIEDILDFKINSAPYCKTAKQHQYLPIAYWTGLSDGDSWAIDLEDASICAVYLGVDFESEKSLKTGIYLRFHEFNDWLSYLCGVAVRRKIDKDYKSILP